MKKKLPIDYKKIENCINKNRECFLKLNFSPAKNIQNVFLEKYNLNVDAVLKLPSLNTIDVYLIVNSSGDSELMYLVSIKENQIIDGLLIADSKTNEEAVKTFNIDNDYSISIFEEFSNAKRKLTEKYKLNNKGKFLIY